MINMARPGNPLLELGTSTFDVLKEKDVRVWFVPFRNFFLFKKISDSPEFMMTQYDSTATIDAKFHLIPFSDIIRTRLNEKGIDPKDIFDLVLMQYNVPSDDFYLLAVRMSSTLKLQVYPPEYENFNTSYVNVTDLLKLAFLRRCRGFIYCSETDPSLYSYFECEEYSFLRNLIYEHDVEKLLGFIGKVGILSFPDILMQCLNTYYSTFSPIYKYYNKALFDYFINIKNVYNEYSRVKKEAFNEYVSLKRTLNEMYTMYDNFDELIKNDLKMGIYQNHKDYLSYSTLLTKLFIDAVFASLYNSIFINTFFFKKEKVNEKEDYT
ncbi:MAG: hypothetical protein N3A54_01680 [Patescibacteria group bacterium]|nr:hypothetical protein [Patescibacteria group bacterium]